MLNESASELKVEKTLEEVEVKEIITEENKRENTINVERDFNSLCYIWSIWIVILINLFCVSPSR